MNFPMYSIRIFDLENEDITDFTENQHTNLLCQRACVQKFAF